jgi:hypothetical protein
MWIAAACVGGSPILAAFVHKTWPVDAVAFADHQSVFEALVTRGATEHAKMFLVEYQAAVSISRNNYAPLRQAWQGGHLDTVKWLWRMSQACKARTRVSFTPPDQWYVRCIEAKVENAHPDARTRYLQMLRWGVAANGYVGAWPVWVQQYVKEYQQCGVVSPGVVPTNGQSNALLSSLVLTPIPEERACVINPCKDKDEDEDEDEDSACGIDEVGV